MMWMTWEVTVTVPPALFTVATALVAKARPDGYTLLMGVTGSNAIAQALYAKLPYDVVKDFAPVEGGGDSGFDWEGCYFWCRSAAPRGCSGRARPTPPPSAPAPPCSVHH